MDRKRHSISVETKLKILKTVDQKQYTYQQIADKFNCGKSSITEIVKKREKYEDLSVNLKRQKIRDGKYPTVEAALIMWVKQMRATNVPLSGNLVKEKAAQFAEKLNIEFKPNDGWLDRFKRRNDLVFKNIVGEKAAVSSEVVSVWVNEKLPLLLDGYSKSDVFNLDETGLFYRLLPNKTLEFRNNDCAGGKLCKERITVLVGSNADGSEKLPLLIIGKSAKPRCFKNIKTLPVMYKNNRKSWMTHVEWEQFLIKMDKKFLNEGRKVLFLADNCPSHLLIPRLRAIKLEFFPPNTTAVAQPMDQGVIKILKGYYREFIVKKLIAALENEEAVSAIHFKINLLDALHFLKRAWDKVKAETINNCFCKAGFFPGTSSQQLASSNINANFELLWNNPQLEKFVGDTAIQEYLSVDDNIVISEEIDDDDILNQVHNDVTDLEEDSSDIEEYQQPTRAEVENSLKIIRLALSIGDGTENNLHHLHLIENTLDVLSQKYLKQSKLTDFFHNE